jgi:hypothetical protein
MGGCGGSRDSWYFVENRKTVAGIEAKPSLVAIMTETLQIEM